ncbi:MAG: peptidylprolyl isomerase [Myxococcales bacterium]|nr:peptidylprolyl isomerase [Myxococcales bacterium]
MLAWTRGVLADPLGVHPSLAILGGVHDLLDRPGSITLSEKPGAPTPALARPAKPSTSSADSTNASARPDATADRSTSAKPGARAAAAARPTDLSARPAPLPPAWRELVAAIVAAAEALAANAPDDTYSRLARVACQARALLARDPAWRAPLVCEGHPPHLTAGLTADLLGRGFGGPLDERLAHLERLRRDPDPRVRASAVSALLKIRGREPVPDAVLLGSLADPSPAVVGSLADALSAGPPDPQPPLSEPVRAALAARASAELTRETELYAALTAALAATASPVEPCSAGLRHPNPSVRAAARACVTALVGDPGPQLADAAPALPPHPPRPGPPIHWRLTSERGVIDVHLDPDAAPWHVAAIVALTRAGFYDGLTFHRVVPGFVVQGGDPEGTGWGGPGFTLPSEPGAARFTRGAVGVADAGKDTGGSQFFFMQARAPHLEGRFTRIGEVAGGIDVVDALLVGDKILRAEILAP